MTKEMLITACHNGYIVYKIKELSPRIRIKHICVIQKEDTTHTKKFPYMTLFAVFSYFIIELFC